ncbi:MAG: mitochondrial fission protein ELM1 [Desulforhopalus sp.]|jgi:mitochondrial fission protein ELM1
MNNSEKSVVTVVVVVDGRPGHEKQSLGIVQALATIVQVNTFVVDISKRKLSAQFKSYLDFLLSFSPTNISFPEKADLVIGTGTRTHSTVLNIKKHFKIPAVTCMTPGRHIRKFFDICFVPEHDGCERRNNYFFTCGAPNICVNKGQHQKDKGLILLGGIDEKSHVWDSSDIEGKISQIISQEKHVDWIISSSPRTPQITVAAVRILADSFTNADFFHYKDTRKGWVEEQYDLCSTVWVTTDSISMLYEALSSGCRVNVLQMKWKRSSSKFKKNEDLLLDKKLVTPFSSWKSGSEGKPATHKLNEAQRCADYILEKCWPQN